MVTELHDQRLAAVLRALRRTGARSILDLGCGAGALLARLVREPQFERITGVERSTISLRQASEALRLHGAEAQQRVALVHGSYEERNEQLRAHDAATLIETIEHNPPGRLSVIEDTIFGWYRPSVVIVTTPNREYNVLYGLSDGVLREPDHRFEWGRSKFRSWATRVARRHGYRVSFQGIGERDPELGCPTQMGVFHRPGGTPAAMPASNAHGQPAVP